MFDFPNYNTLIVATALPKRCAWQFRDFVIPSDLVGMDAPALADANEFISHTVSYKPDGLHDYWQDPDDTMEKETGDCEDFCVAKYAVLHSLGLRNMAVVVGMDVWAPAVEGQRQIHALLFVKLDDADESLVLDNRTPLIHPASYFEEIFSPIYAVNERLTWAYLPQ